jgi:hypothetical protein
MACLLAGSPTFRSPDSVKATIEGVVRLPSLLGITTGSFPSITETHEFVVPRSIPIIFPIFLYFFSDYYLNFNVTACNVQSLCQMEFEANACFMAG